MGARRGGFGAFSGVAQVPADIRARGRESSILPPVRPTRTIEGQEVHRAQAVVFPPTFLPPLEATNFAGTDSGTIVGTGAGLVNWTIPAGLVIRVPGSSVAIISSWTVYINNMATTTQAIYQLRINGAPVDAWGRYTLFPRAAASVAEVVFESPVYVQAPQGAIIDVLVSIGDAATYQVGATVTGWAYPQRIAEQYQHLLGSA